MYAISHFCKTQTVLYNMTIFAIRLTRQTSNALSQNSNHLDNW